MALLLTKFGSCEGVRKVPGDLNYVAPINMCQNIRVNTFLGSYKHVSTQSFTMYTVIHVVDPINLCQKM